MKRFAGILAAQVLCSAAFGAIDGTVTNRTTGRPQPGIAVNLIKLGRGMEMASSVKTDGQGRFRFPIDAEPQMPYLVQAFHEGVSYSKMIQPATPTSGLAVDVYDVSSNATGVKTGEHIIFLEPGPSGLQVNELIAVRNEGNVTLNDEAGTIRFWLPPAASGQVRVSVSTGAGMPIQRKAEQTNQANIWSVAYPIKPGETRFNLTYMLPAADTFQSQILHSANLRLVAPHGVQISGDTVKQLGTEPQTQATIYSAQGPNLNVQVSDTPAAAATAPAAAGGEEDSGSGVEQKLPFLYKRLPLILALAGGILFVGFVLLYRKQAGHAPPV
ncbi:MAG TPA: carboxypeptidase-like regulatory domain-containing protein [Bryobacteraceae bacterium]|nr:carboxypeptidase-like regulatory domain-containing protein [Bryobacteraceae bacterium]